VNFNKTVEQSPGGGLEFRYPALKFMGAVSHMFQHPKNQKTNNSIEVARCTGAFSGSVEQQAEVNVKDTDGWTPLHSAAQSGYLDVVKFLVEQQAEVNAKDIHGWTPLHLAAGNGHLDVVKFLIEQQAEVNMKEIDG
jgi:ankyrin repeat protein